MSWLSELLYGKSREKKKARRERRRTEQAQQQAKAKERRELEKWDRNLGKASGSAESDVMRYFKNLGVDPGAYGSDISSYIKSLTSGAPRGSDISGLFSGAGGDLFNQLQGQERQRALSSINKIAPQGFASDRIGDTLDDEIIAQILGEGRGKAEGYVQNLVDRGVITGTGAAGAHAGIEDQSARALGQLNELGSTILGGGRAQLEDIANSGRFAASNLNLGQGFDAGAYGSRIDTAFDDFVSGLEGKFRAQAPQNLFQTGGLAALAGQAQGPQNTTYSRSALAGIVPEEEEETRGVGNVF